ncbi:MAG: ABC transporter permease [Candidatus Saganbacteria bacterium]|nr:ABC transporter permease [Candidatus Saganbacteria bacterium]
MNLFWLAYKNFKRNKFWTVITIVIAAVAIASIFASFTIVNCINYSLETGRERLGADLVVFPSGEENAMISAFQTGTPALFYMKKDLTEKIKKIDGVDKVTPELFLMTLSKSCCSLGIPFRLIGFDASTDFVITPWLQKNRINSLKADEVIIGADIPSMKGEKIKILGSEFRVAGVLERTGIGADKSIYLPLDSARQLAMHSLMIKYRPDEISSVLVKVSSGTDISVCAENIKKAIPQVAVMGSSQFNRGIKVIFDRMVIMAVLIFIVVMVLSSVSITGVFYAMSKARGPEIGILRSLGATRRDIFSLVLIESVFSTVIGGIIGVLVSAFLIYDFNLFLSKHLPFPFILSFGGVVEMGAVCILISAVLGLLGALYPAAKSSKIDPFDAIRQGS